MIKQQVILEVKKEDRIYQFQLPSNCSLGEVFDVLFQMRSYVVEKISESQKADQPKEPEQPKEG